MSVNSSAMQLRPVSVKQKKKIGGRSMYAPADVKLAVVSKPEYSMGKGKRGKKGGSFAGAMAEALIYKGLQTAKDGIQAAIKDPTKAISVAMSNPLIRQLMGGSKKKRVKKLGGMKLAVMPSSGIIARGYDRPEIIGRGITRDEGINRAINNRKYYQLERMAQAKLADDIAATKFIDTAPAGTKLAAKPYLDQRLKDSRGELVWYLTP